MQPADEEDSWPKVRLGQQAACCVGFDTKRPWLLMTGGRLQKEEPFQDMWLFDLGFTTWKEVNPYTTRLLQSIAIVQ